MSYPETHTGPEGEQVHPLQVGNLVFQKTNPFYVDAPKQNECMCGHSTWVKVGKHRIRLDSITGVSEIEVPYMDTPRVEYHVIMVGFKITDAEYYDVNDQKKAIEALRERRASLLKALGVE